MCVPVAFTVTVDSELSRAVVALQTISVTGSAIPGEEGTQPENTDKFPL